MLVLIYIISGQKMADTGSCVAADQDVPVQADQHQQCAGPDHLADGWRGHIRPDEAVTRTAAAKMGQLSTRQGWNYKMNFYFIFFSFRLDLREK
jgi:hypothetical protein